MQHNQKLTNAPINHLATASAAEIKELLADSISHTCTDLGAGLYQWAFEVRGASYITVVVATVGPKSLTSN